MITYPDSVQYLYSLGNESKTIRMGLERITTLVEALGRPDRRYAHVHVAGTNGKGSTCAMIEAGLRAGGRRTGLYTSPHLVEPTERIAINGQAVSREEFARAFDVVHRLAVSLLDQGRLDGHPTYFETVTAMAFLLFAEAGIDIAVTEVGLGGRLDATNVIQPAVSVITPIDFDHERWLGNTITAIAREKAAIIREGVPVIMAPQREEARLVVRAQAHSTGAPVIDTSQWRIERLALKPDGSRFRLRRPPDTFGVTSPLAGEHQVENARTAAVALLTLGLSPGDISRGIAQARWPGRLEHVAESPEIILDGAHNPAGIKTLAAHIRRFYRERRVWILFGAMRDKAVDEIGEHLAAVAQEILLVQVDSPRALRPAVLAPLVDHPRVRPCGRLAEALEIVGREAAPGDVVFITGSLFLVGEARALLKP